MKMWRKILNIALIFFISNSLLLQTAYTQSGLNLNPINSNYIGLIQQKINSFIVYPSEAAVKGWEGTSRVKFTIAQDGSIKNIGIVKSSGFPLLDTTAISAVKDAEPYPPPGPKQLELQLNVVFKKPEMEEPVAIPTPKTEETQPMPLSQDYINLIKQRVKSHSLYPLEAAAKGWEGTVRVKFTITKDGTVKNIGIVKSSGYPLLDTAAISAVSNGSPYPYPGPEQLEVQVNVVFKKSEKEPPAEPPSEELASEKPVLEKPDNVDRLIAIALENHPVAQIAQEQIELAQLKINQTRRELFPALAAEWKKSEGKTITDPYRSKSYGIQAEQIIFDSGKREYNLRRAKLSLKIARKNYESIKNELTAKVKKTYYELAKAKAALENWKETSEKIKKELELVKRLYDSKLTTEIELLSAQSLYDRVGHYIKSTEADVSLAKLNFQQMLNVDSIEELEPLVCLNLEFKELDIHPEEALEEAQKLRPDIQLSKLSVESSKYAELIAQRENRPKVSLSTFMGKSGEAYSNEALTMVDQWSVIAKVSWLFGGSTIETSTTRDEVPSKEITDTSVKTESTTVGAKFALLNNLAYYSDKKEAQISYKQLLNELHELEQKTAAEVYDAYYFYQKSMVQANLALNEMQFKKKELKLRLMKQNIGEIPISSTMAGRITLAEAKSTYIQAIAGYHIAVALLNKAIGVSDYYY